MPYESKQSKIICLAAFAFCILAFTACTTAKNISASQTEAAGTGAVEPPDVTAKSEENFVLEIWYKEIVQESVIINDKESVSAMKDIISARLLSSVINPCVNVDKIGDYFRFYETGGKDNTMYYAFINETIAASPQIQIGNDQDKLTRTDISQKTYEQIHALWESHMALPKTVKAVSAGDTVDAQIFRNSADIDLKEIREKLNFLKISKDTAQGPFSVYADGIEQYGSYKVYDADTYAELIFAVPSGLAPQTTIFKNAKQGHRYIVELSTGYWCSGRIYGIKIVFGAAIP